MLKAKKSLGQNFLKSEPALREIIKAGEIKTSDTVLEIGPGRGALTKKILETGCKVVAVEKDGELFHFLHEKFATEVATGALILSHGDILEFQPKKYNLDTTTYKIIANIPYNITGAILKKFLTEEHQPESMVLMVQQEVARRIVARDGKESILSISVKAYGTPKIVMKVPKRYFSPAPKVDSAVIEIKGISAKMFKVSGISQEHFWEVVKAGFAHKRKLLSSNLKGLISEEKEQILAKENKRAEEMTLSEWFTLIA